MRNKDDKYFKVPANIVKIDNLRAAVDKVNGGMAEDQLFTENSALLNEINYCVKGCKINQTISNTMRTKISTLVKLKCHGI